MGYYDVKPRYTPGSGAMVSPRQAGRVLVQEWEGYEHAAEGIYGEAKQQDAWRDPLSGIVLYLRDWKGGLLYFDLVTGEILWRREDRAGRMHERVMHEWSLEQELERRRADAIEAARDWR